MNTGYAVIRSMQFYANSELKKRGICYVIIGKGNRWESNDKLNKNDIRNSMSCGVRQSNSMDGYGVKGRIVHENIVGVKWIVS